VDELEEFTGIDFFCNLNDKLEEAVEKQYNKTAWGL
jgi:endonuclease G